MNAELDTEQTVSVRKDTRTHLVEELVAFGERKDLLGSVDDIRRSHGGSTTVRIAVTDGVAALIAAVEAEPWAVRHTPVARDDQAIDVVVNDLDAARQALPGLIAGLGLGLRRFDELEVSLEEVFVDLVGVNR